MWRAALVAALSLGVARAADDRKKHNKRLKFHAHEAPVLYSLDASPGLVDHAFSALGSLSSIANAATNASSARAGTKRRDVLFFARSVERACS